MTNFPPTSPQFGSRFKISFPEPDHLSPTYVAQVLQRNFLMDFVDKGQTEHADVFTVSGHKMVTQSKGHQSAEQKIVETVVFDDADAALKNSFAKLKQANMTASLEMTQVDGPAIQTPTDYGVAKQKLMNDIKATVIEKNTSDERFVASFDECSDLSLAEPKGLSYLHSGGKIIQYESL